MLHIHIHTQTKDAEKSAARDEELAMLGRALRGHKSFKPQQTHDPCCCYEGDEQGEKMDQGKLYHHSQQDRHLLHSHHKQCLAGIVAVVIVINITVNISIIKLTRANFIPSIFVFVIDVSHSAS